MLNEKRRIQNRLYSMTPTCLKMNTYNNKKIRKHIKILTVVMGAFYFFSASKHLLILYI